MDSPASPPPPAEAQLIRRAREAAGLSYETAAARMVGYTIGSSRWRQIEDGRRSGTPKPVIAKAGTLAHMALAVGLTSDRLADVGRDDAAAVLHEIELQEGKRRPAPPEADASTPLVDERWGMIKGVLELARQGLTRAEYRELVRRLDAHFQQEPEWLPPMDEPPGTSQNDRRTG